MARLLTDMDEAVLVARLVERARAGDRAAGDALVRAFAAEVHALLFRLAGNPEDAEDLTQETFVRALSALDLYRGDGPFGAWLLRIAVHVGRDHLRRKGRRPAPLALVGDPSEGEDVADPRASAGADTLDHDELARQLGHALTRLPDGLRAALALRVLEGRPYDEVAALLGVRPTTARTQVMKARRVLARWLAPWLAPRRGEGTGEGSGGHHDEGC